jgi:hypothetical protein
VAYLTLPYFSTLSKKARFSEKKKLNIKSVLDFSYEFYLLILRRIQGDTVVNVRKSSCKTSVIFVGV